MKLTSIIDKKAQSADYMVDEITHICKTFGKRDPGSQGEHDACDYMADVLKNDCGCEKVAVEPFEVHPDSFFGWIYFTFSFAIASLITLFFMPLLSAILFVCALTCAFLQFGIYKKFLDKCFPKKTSHNVTAVKSCSGEVKRRIFFNGHPDAAWEWPANYRFGGVVFEMLAVIATVGAFFYGVLGLLLVIARKSVGFAILTGAGSEHIYFILGLCGLVFLPFWIYMFFMWNKKLIVDGANDNLTGCYMGIAILKALKDQGIILENTEVGVILSGSEEAGLRGAKAWGKAHAEEYKNDKAETIIVSYDTIRESKYLMVNYRNINGTMRTDKQICDMLVDASKEQNIHLIKGWVPPFGGATDDAAFVQAGLRAAGITGLNHNLQNYYHTRRDTYDNMGKECLADCFAVSVQLLEDYDSGKYDK